MLWNGKDLWIPLPDDLLQILIGWDCEDWCSHQIKNWRFLALSMDLAYTCVKHQRRLYVCVCVTKCVHLIRNGARFARLPLLASLARFLTG